MPELQRFEALPKMLLYTAWSSVNAYNPFGACAVVGIKEF